MVLIWLLAETSSPAACCSPKLSALIWASCPVELNNQTCNNLTQPQMHQYAGPATAPPLPLPFPLFFWPESTSNVVQVCVRMANGLWLILSLLDIRIFPPKTIFFKLVYLAWQESVFPFHSLPCHKQTHKMEIRLERWNASIKMSTCSVSCHKSNKL